MVVCYTNHALDDFLEDLLDAGIESIVRLGGRSNNDRLEQYNLREMSRNGKAPFTREQNWRYKQLMDQIEEAEKDAKRLEKVCSMEVGAKWWRTIGPFLETHYPELWRQLRVGDPANQDSDGFMVYRVGGEDHLWKRWLKGASPSQPFLNRASQSLWTMTKEESIAAKKNFPIPKS